MKFKAKQFCSGYQYFTFEATDQRHAERLIAMHNSGEDPEDTDINLVEEGFDADDGGEVYLIK